MLTGHRREFGKERPLLVILHDPPEMIASPDPRTGKVELHNTWLVSGPEVDSAAMSRQIADVTKD